MEAALRRALFGQALRWSAPCGVVAVLVGTVAVGARWPTLPAASLAAGLGLALGAAVLGAGRLSTAWILTSVVTVAAGLAGSLATRTSTLAALGATTVAAVVCAVVARRAGGRTAGWLVAVGAGELLAFAAARAGGVPVRWAAYCVLLVAAVAVATGTRLRDRSGAAVEAAGHASALVALALTTGAAVHAAGVCALWGLVVGARALAAGYAGRPHLPRTLAAIGCELLAYWLLLVAGGVWLLEAYTVPAALVGLLTGWLVARTRPGLHSWVAYGPALLAGVLPSLAALDAGGGGAAARRIALGAAGVCLVLAGSARRRQAPVVVGGGVLVVVALHETFVLWDALPQWRWVLLAVGGLLLVGVATTYERRRRDLVRLRDAVVRLG